MIGAVRISAAAFDAELGHLPSQGTQLSFDALIDPVPGFVESAVGAGHGSNERYGHPPQRSYDELHGVDGLESLNASGAADDADHLFGQKGRVPVTKKVQPVERVLEGPAYG